MSGRWVDQVIPWSTNRSSPRFTIKSSISTSPLYRKEAFLKQKYVVEGFSARQISFLIGCSHHAVNQALKKFGMKREIHRRGRLPYELGLSKRGRIYEKGCQRIVQKMIRLRRTGKTYREIARLLEELGVSTPVGKTRWYAGTVRAILKRSQ